MAVATGARKTISIHDYPEHLNPFHEDDHHNKIRFWTIGKKLNRSNSISFSSIKDIKNSWAFRSFMRKGKKEKVQQAADKSNNHVNGESSPIVFRRAMQYSSMSTVGARSTVASPERYVYGGSITPLPRSRFQERLRSTSQLEVNSLSATPRMARSEVSGSRLSVESTNPFDEPPVPPVRASRRKKKRAPPPPPNADVSITSTNSELQTSAEEEKKPSNNESELEIEDMSFNVELKIVEDEEVQKPEAITTIEPAPTAIEETVAVTATVTVNEETPKPVVEETSDTKEVEHSIEPTTTNELIIEENKTNNNEPDDDDDDIDVEFPKVDIVKYRRNSSLNEDDIRLRRGNLEDYALSNKRSKSLANALDSGFVPYDLNENRIDDKDTNGNGEPQKVICKVYDDGRKQSIDNSISSTEKEFIEIDKATRELEREISKLNFALQEDDELLNNGSRMSVNDIKRRFDKGGASSPNPIPKPRRSYGGSISPVNGNAHT